MKMPFKWFAVCAPIIVMAIWLGKLVYIGSPGTDVELKVSAHDPRDILSGQYVSYSVMYGDLSISSDLPNPKDGSVCI